MAGENGKRVAGTGSELVSKYALHLNPAFIKLLKVLGYGRIFTRALDVWVWDSRGRKYLDCLAAFGSVNIGHNHPDLRKRLHEFLDEEHINFCHFGATAQPVELAEELTRETGPLEVCLYTSGGAEAVEAAMKLAQAATGRKGFIYCRGGFHGNSPGTLGLMGEKRMRKVFEPLSDNCREIPFGDLEALEGQLKQKSAAAFIVEPIQIEAGVILPPPGYFKAAAELCRKYGTLLALDEVQTGLGRTGSLFAWQREDMTPDILILAKSLSAGMAPIGAALTTRKIHKKAYGSIKTFDLHSSTFQGNAFSCVTALEGLRILKRERLIERSRRMGSALLGMLKARIGKHPMVVDIRGQGLILALEFGPTERNLAGRNLPALTEVISEQIYGQWVALRLLERGIICQPASHNWNILRLEPPLTLRATEARRLIDEIVHVLEENQGLPSLLGRFAGRLLSSNKELVF